APAGGGGEGARAVAGGWASLRAAAVVCATAAVVPGPAGRPWGDLRAAAGGSAERGARCGGAGSGAGGRGGAPREPAHDLPGYAGGSAPADPGGGCGAAGAGGRGGERGGAFGGALGGGAAGL